jgi:hypothetical protein
MTDNGERSGRSGRRPSTSSGRSVVGDGWTYASHQTSPSKVIYFGIRPLGRGTMDDTRERRRNDLIGLAFGFGFPE